MFYSSAIPPSSPGPLPVHRASSPARVVRVVVTLGLLAALSVSNRAADLPYTFGTLAGLGLTGSADGTGTAARFLTPWGVAVDAAGNVYVADRGNATIRKIGPAGTVSTLAGLAGNLGSIDGIGSAARFSSPVGLAVDGGGNVYVSDDVTIRKITPSGTVSTLAGLAGDPGSMDGPGVDARFALPAGVAVDATGNVLVADSGNHSIRSITPEGVVSTLAGNGAGGSADGNGAAAQFANPFGVTVDAAGNAYVADTLNFTVRKITPAGDVSTLAGMANQPGIEDGTGSAARFYVSAGIAVDNTTGNVYVTDAYSNTIRKITPDAVVTTLAGLAGEVGNADGTGSAARFSLPFGIAVDGAGNVSVADSNNCVIRRITPTGNVSTFAGPGGSSGSADGPGVVARFTFPDDVAVDAAGNVYVPEFDNHTVRKITSNGTVSTLAGLAGSPGSTDGVGSGARFNSPASVALDAAGNVYLADANNNAIRKITPQGTVSTLAGLAGSPPGSADGTGSAAQFSVPQGIAVDTAGNVYVADTGNYTIRKITPAGTVSTLAGLAGSLGSTDGVGSSARFQFSEGVAVDTAGIVYVADTGNYTIRKITPDGTVTTLAGLAGSAGSTDGTGSAARFFFPEDLIVDATGNLFVADTGNHILRAITPEGTVTTLAGLAGRVGSEDGTASAARFNRPIGIAVDGVGNLFVADGVNNTIRKGVMGNPVILTQPASQIVTAPASVTFTVVASGTPAPITQWQVSIDGGTTWSDLTNSAPYSGATTGVLTITSTPGSLNGNLYRLVATSSGSTAASSAATLIVYSAPAFTTQPSDRSVTAGSSVSFTASATGYPLVVHQWQISTNGGMTWSDLSSAAPYSGATTPTLTVSPVSESLSRHQYRNVATNSIGSTPSTAATLTTVRRHLVDLNGDSSGDVFLLNLATGAWRFEVVDPITGAFVETASAINWDPGWQVYPLSLNHDAFTDLFLYEPVNGIWVQALNHGGDGTFTYTSGTWDPGWSVFPADFDGDGVTDLLVYNRTTGSAVKNFVDGSGGFSAPASVTWNPGWTITVADLNGDGRDDLFLYDPAAGIWQEAFSQAGAGDFDYPAAGRWDAGWQIHPADLNGDGRTDLVVYNAAGEHVSALSRAAGDFDYVGGPQWAAGWTIAPGDLDNDGWTDLFLYRPADGAWAEAFSDGAGGFIYAAGQWDPGWSLAVTDLDGDGRTDIIMGRADGVWVQAINTGIGTFTYAVGNWGPGWSIYVRRSGDR